MNPVRTTPQVVAVCFLALSSLSACKARSDAASDSTETTAANAQPATHGDPPVSVLDEYHYGAIRFGMTYREANDSLKGALKAQPGANLAECDYVRQEGGAPGIMFMVLENKVVRVDVDSGGHITMEGAGVGDTEERIKTLYGNRVSVSPHKYDEGNYLTVKSTNPADSMNLIIFETVKGTVKRYRAGLMPGVGFIEGCS